MGKVVLVLGASGMFGSHAAQAFAAAGWEVRKYQRGTDIHQAAEGAKVIVNAMNPPMYHDWDNLIPQITAQAIAAAKSSGATLLVPGNVYVYGREPAPWGPDTPQRPVARKGAIRAQMEQDYRAASEDGVQVILLRGGIQILRLQHRILRHLTVNHLPQLEHRSLENVQALLQLRREPLLLGEILS